jgi:hypothetical protein
MDHCRACVGPIASSRSIESLIKRPRRGHLVLGVCEEFTHTVLLLLLPLPELASGPLRETCRTGCND